MPPVADIAMVPVTFGAGRGWVPPDPVDSATRYSWPGAISPVSGVTCQAPVAEAEWYCTDQPATGIGSVPRLVSSMKSVVHNEPALPPPP